MGDIKNKANEVYRDYETDGVPATPLHDPDKIDIRALFGLIDTVAYAAQAGVTTVADIAARDAFFSDADNQGKLVYVNDNNGEPDDPANGVYEYVDGAARIAEGFYQGVATVVQPLVDEANTAADAAEAAAALVSPIVLAGSGINKFNHATRQIGKEISAATGLRVTQATSVTTGLVDVTECDQAITISGLVAGTFAKQWSFFAADGTTLITTQPRGFIGLKRTSATIPKPEGAKYFEMTLSTRDGTGGDYSGVQIQDGFVATTFEAFKADELLTMGGKITGPRTQRRLLYAGGGKNLFDKSRVIEGFEVHATLGLPVQDTDITTGVPTSSISYPIDVERFHGKSLSISGLQASSTVRGYAFYSSAFPSAATRISGGNIAIGATGINALAIPGNAVTFVLSPRQRGGTATIDYSAIQVEVASVATPFAAYVDRISRTAGLAFIGATDPAATAPNYKGGVLFILGDSISQTQPDGGPYLYPVAKMRDNWVDYAIPQIAPDACYNFALSGAHFATIAALSTYQKFENQVTAAVAAAVQPRSLVVSLGTNDWSSSNTLPSGYGGLGNHATAMGKSLTFDGAGVPTTTLDKTVSLEAMRLGFARLRWHFADTVMFCALPLQRADYTADQMLAWMDAIAKMARTYGFEVIDCFGQSGILKEFEVVSGAGRDLSDGLHTDASGQAKQGKLIASRIMARLSA